MKNNNRIIWAIAAFDSANLAGINQDSRVIDCLGYTCKQIVSAQTAQSTKQATLIEAVSSDMMQAQLSILWQEQIPSAIKIGVLANNEQLQILIDFFSQASVQKHNIPIIFDPVLKSSSGLQFNDWDIQLLSKLMAFCTLVTPNEQEYRHLSSASKSFNPFNGSNLLVSL